MLTLTRKLNEQVIIGNPDHPLGTITVARISHDRVRLAFDFPKAIEIHRHEVADTLGEEEDPHAE